MEQVWERLETEAFTAEREWCVEGIPVLTAAVSLPRPVGPQTRTLRRIRRYYRAQAGAFLRYCQRQLLPMAAEAYRVARVASRPLPCLRAELTYCVTYNAGGFWSLYTQSSEPTESGRRLLRRWGDTWELRSGYPAALRQFFPPRSPWRRLLLDTAAQEICRQEAAGCARYAEGWRRRLRRSLSPLNFYLTEEGLAFFYPMYAIAPAVEGIPVFTVPYDRLYRPPCGSE